MIQVQIKSGSHLGVNQRMRLTNLFSTPKGSVPHMRDFGIPNEPLDMPIQAAVNILAAAMAEACEKWEPSVRVVSVTPNYENCAEGRVSLTVEVAENV